MLLSLFETFLTAIPREMQHVTCELELTKISTDVLHYMVPLW